jgi:hypothetical protein
MRNKIATITAVSVPLILSAAGALAGDLQFQTPTTDRAQQTQTLLGRAAHAVNAGATRAGEVHISNLWVFPTADENTVFAQYTVTTNRSNAAASEEHLELLRMKGDRIVEQRDLTHATGSQTASAHWTSKIGTARAADSSTSATPIASRSAG